MDQQPATPPQTLAAAMRIIRQQQDAIDDRIRSATAWLEPHADEYLAVAFPDQPPATLPVCPAAAQRQ